MKLVELLEKKKATIIDKWFDFIVKTYPPDTAYFMKSKNDRFANPVGTTYAENLDALFNEILENEISSEEDRDNLVKFLDPIIRIRAIQNFSASQATVFTFSLKNIVREIIEKELKEKKIFFELLTFETKLDKLSMLAFDVYMGCRETIYNLKANEEKTKIYKAFRRAGLVSEITEDDPGLMESITS